MPVQSNLTRNGDAGAKHFIFIGDASAEAIEGWATPPPPNICRTYKDKGTRQRTERNLIRNGDAGAKHLTRNGDASAKAI
jgi:hypothetical protein